MRWKFVFIVMVVLLCLADCGKKEKKKIEVKESISVEQIEPVTVNKGELNPELFFEINLKINRITKEYNKKVQEDGQEKINKLLKELDDRLNEIYKEYNITEETLNKYSETHYKELAQYLNAHPEIEKKLRR